MRHGFGFELFLSGSFYIGEHKKNRAHGKGKFINKATGEKYSGQWFQGLKHGYGIFVREGSAFCYAGFWLNNEPHGYGIMRTECETVYEGRFQSGKKHGTG
jgi:hypothetical protein